MSAREDLARSARAFLAEQQKQVETLSRLEEEAQGRCATHQAALETAQKEAQAKGEELLKAMAEEEAASKVLEALGVATGPAQDPIPAESPPEEEVPRPTTMVEAVLLIVRHRPGRNFTGAEVTNILRQERPDLCTAKHSAPSVHNALRRLAEAGRIDRFGSARGVAYQARGKKLAHLDEAAA